MSISRNISILAQGASASGILSETFGGTGFTSKIVRGTSVTLTTQTSVDFTSIPSWVKRITLMFNGVSTSGSSAVMVQIGSTSFTTTGYVGTGTGYSSGSSGGSAAFTTGFATEDVGNSTYLRYGQSTLYNVSGNIWVFSSTHTVSGTIGSRWGGGSLTLSGVLDRVRLTTVNGTDTFDAGTVNILYE